MRKRAAQDLSPQMGRMGDEDPSRAFSVAALKSVDAGEPVGAEPAAPPLRFGGEVS